jgi:thiol-disulfide isomerase/thioredoxin
MEELQKELMGETMVNNFKKGEEMADFDLSDMDGKQVKLSDYRGKVVLINFWFINCPPCRMEMPDLNALKKDYIGKDVEFIAITFDQRNDINEFLTKIPFDYRIFPNAQQAIQDYGIMGFPTSVVIDKNGKIVDSKMGGSINIKEELQAFIEKALTAK